MGVGEACDLVVHQARGEPGRDHVCLAESASPSFWTDHPDRAIRLDPRLQVHELFQISRRFRAEEDKIARRWRLAVDYVRCPLPEQRHESRVIEVNYRDLGSRLDAELVKKRTRA